MKVLHNNRFGESRTFLLEDDIPVQIIIRRDLVLNVGDIVAAKIRTFHPILKGYFAETPKGDVFIPKSVPLTEGETVTVQITKEARQDKVATAHFVDENEVPPTTKGIDISDEMADELIAEAMAPDIHLKGGGELHIERTRVCWTIDVDTGQNLDDMADVNECAANEIVHQIRLKNMGGLILVDFAGSKRGMVAVSLMDKIKEAFWDRKEVMVRGWTRSGLLEIERKRIRAELWTACSPNNPVNVYYQVRRAVDKCRLKHPILTVSLPVFNLLNRQGIKIKMKAAYEVPISYFSLEEEK